MDKLSMVVALAALGLGAYLVVELGAREERLDSVEQNLQLVQTSVSDLDGKLDKMLARLASAEAPLLDADAPTPEDIAAGSSDGIGLAGRRPPTAGERLAALERRVADQRKSLAALEEKSSAAPALPDPTQFLRNNAFYPNAAAAAKALELSESQTADLNDTVERAKRELADLYEIENDEGETWSKVRKGNMTTFGDSGLQISMPDFKKINAFKNARVPGTSETFGDAEKRIKERAFADVRRGLTPAQTKKWDAAHKDSLLGSGMGGPGATFMVSSFGTPSGPDEK